MKAINVHKCSCNGHCIRIAMYVNKRKPPQRKEYKNSTLDSVLMSIVTHHQTKDLYSILWFWFSQEYKQD